MSDLWPHHDAPVRDPQPSATECSGSAAIGWSTRGYDGLIFHPWNPSFGSCVPQFVSIKPPSWPKEVPLDSDDAEEVAHLLSSRIPSGWSAKPEGFFKFAEVPRPTFIFGVDYQYDFLPIGDK